MSLKYEPSSQVVGVDSKQTSGDKTTMIDQENWKYPNKPVL